MNDLATALAGLSLLAWVYLIAFHGRFWRPGPYLEDSPPLAAWPDVAVVVPARNEAKVIARSVVSLLRQDYPGRLVVVLVDDGSDDGTAEAARRAAQEAGQAERLTIMRGAALAEGWTGKLWAVSQGVDRAREILPGARYLLLTDADIVHPAGNLRRLVAKAESEGSSLVSLMVRLNCESFWERLLIPPFVFFFRKLYPFPRVNDPAAPTAAAAGGCMLVRRTALDRAGGIAAVRAELIDDCALAAVLKRVGPIWLGLAKDTLSRRRYDRLRDIWDMVARTAYTQLRHSPALLGGTVAGMAGLYLLPPAAALLLPLAGAWTGAAAGLAAWLLMAGAYLPVARLYGRPAAAAPTLPLAAFLYTLMTVDSARRHWQGRGGSWKGRTHRPPGGAVAGADEASKPKRTGEPLTPSL